MRSQGHHSQAVIGGVAHDRLSFSSMVKLKSVVGRGPGRPVPPLQQPGENQPTKRKALNEGFAMGPRANERPSLLQHEAYSGPRVYARGSMDKALRLASSAPGECAEALLADVDAQSSRASMRSLQNTWARLASQAGYRNPFELTPDLIFTVMGVLKAAEYRSAANYLEAAKRRHVSSGHPLTDQLRQACRMAARSAKRDLGPPKQAEPNSASVDGLYQGTRSICDRGTYGPGKSMLASVLVALA